MLPQLTQSERLSMSLSQVRRYEKKLTKMSRNNRYYIQYYGYNVALHDWNLERDDSGFIYVHGTLENGNSWETSPIVSMETMDDHYQVITESNTIYRLYW